MSIRENLAAVQHDLPADRQVTLVAVSKYATLDQMLEAYECGIRHFGENKIQDAERKMRALPAEISQNISWHFLGHLQTNKIKNTLAHHFTLIQSVDSIKLAGKLSDANVANQTCQSVLLQVNLTREPQKSGFIEEDLLENYSALIQYPGLDIKGLMTIGPNTRDEDSIRSCFNHLRDLRDQLSNQYQHPLSELSMGMSQDYVHGIECGATIIRIGNRLFGGS